MGTRVCRGVIGGEIGAGQDILAPQLYPKGHEQAHFWDPGCSGFTYEWGSSKIMKYLSSQIEERFLFFYTS